MQHACCRLTEYCNNAFWTTAEREAMHRIVDESQNIKEAICELQFLSPIAEADC
jgi:hypothetical protein